MTVFDSIRTDHKAGMSKRTIARKLDIDIKTVRRTIRKIEQGDTLPKRSSRGRAEFRGISKPALAGSGKKAA